MPLHVLTDGCTAQVTDINVFNEIVHPTIVFVLEHLV
jgi:hypothetical protein